MPTGRQNIELIYQTVQIKNHFETLKLFTVYKKKKDIHHSLSDFFVIHQ